MGEGRCEGAVVDVSSCREAALRWHVHQPLLSAKLHISLCASQWHPKVGLWMGPGAFHSRYGACNREDTPRWCATGCTVRYHPVRRALASILDASLSRLTEIPDDALQFDLVSLSRHNHTLETAVGVKLKSG